MALAASSTASSPVEDRVATIAQLAREASIEITVHDVKHLQDSRRLLPAGKARSGGVKARLVGGLTGPTRLSTLIKFAMRCGAGASMRVLTARPQAFTNLLGDHGPESILRGLAQSLCEKTSDFAGVHLFCFGGFVRTCQWLQAIADGRFILDDAGGFRV